MDSERYAGQGPVPDGCVRVPLLQPERDMGACSEVHLHHHHPHRSFVPYGKFKVLRSLFTHCIWYKLTTDRHACSPL